MESNQKDKPVLLITYFYGSQGCCPAEWADDKVHALECMEKNTVLLTSILSTKSIEKNTRHFRVPSLSLVDLKHEWDDLKNDGSPPPIIKLFLLLPFVLTIGLGLDLLQKLITSGNGGGKWSWAIPASVCALYLAIRYGCNTIFTTGGPASAHLAGSIVKVFTRKRLICELQDPLTGEDIGRNSRSAFLLNWVENIIMKTSDKVVYVTEGAADHARRKYVKSKAEIVAIYPGSRMFEYTSTPENSRVNNELTIIHLGTLYSTRNLYILTEAIDSLINDGEIKDGQIKVLNLGEMYGDLKAHHLSKSYFRQETIKPRQEAIKIASENMVSLLVQHADNRSNATIPYKTYDYINIGNPILALTNSKELYDLLEHSGHNPVEINNTQGVRMVLLELLNDYQAYKQKVRPLAINILKQTQTMFD